MTVIPMAPGSDEQHVSAVRRLARARHEEERLADLHAAAQAVVASREQWLHWVDEGESIAPWEDGEWSPDGRTSRPLPWDNTANPDVRDAMAREPDCSR